MALNSFNKFLCGAGCVTAPNLFLSLSSYNLAVSKSLEDKEKIKKEEVITQKIMKLENQIKEKNETIQIITQDLKHVRYMKSLVSRPTKIIIEDVNLKDCEIPAGSGIVYLRSDSIYCKKNAK